MAKKFLGLFVILGLLLGVANVWAGGWSFTDSMNIPRHKHTATLLESGKLLVTGGGYSSGYWVVISGCEVYDTSTNTWSSTDPMGEKREWHTATLLPNNKVLVTGGFGGFEYPTSCEIYDPLTGSWSYSDPLSIRREGHTATLLPNGKVLVVGGGPYISSCEIYDPSTGSWSATGSLHLSRYGHTATLLQDGRVLVTGGFCPGVSITTCCEIYDTTTGTWSYADSMNTNREGHTATLLPDGRVLVVGGYGYAGEDLVTFSSCEIYDPLTDSWSYTDSLSADRAGHTATLLPNNKLLVTGGSHYDGTWWHSLSSCEIYDLSTNLWSDADPMNNQRVYHTASLLPDGQVLVVGGTNETSCEIYNPEVGIKDPLEGGPIERFYLYQNYPNPFNSTTAISYQVSAVGPLHTTLTIYNIAGQKVRILVDGFQKPGYHQVHWDGRGDAGKEASSGVYLYRLEVEGYTEARKLLILR